MSRNLIHIAPLKAYDQTWDYYNRVIGDNGMLIDAEAVNRIYHGLNLLNLENRSYKLYHASAGLQKTDDQIDKLYDLGKDDVDQIFSGSDRPEHVQGWSNSEGVGNWQISVEKEATNNSKESNDLGGIFGGSWTKTEGKGDSPFGDSNEAVEVAMNTDSTGASNYIELDVDTATNFSSGDYITVSFYAKKIAGSSGEPELLIEGEDSNSNPISLIQETFSTQVGEYQFFEYTAQWSADGTLRQAGCRIQDNDSSADTVYQFWGMQIERGQYATSRIHTDGGIATRSAPLTVAKSFAPATGTVVVFAEVIKQRRQGIGSEPSTVISNILVHKRPGGAKMQIGTFSNKFRFGLNGNIQQFNSGLSVNEEINICMLLTYNGTEAYAVAMDSSGNAERRIFQESGISIGDCGLGYAGDNERHGKSRFFTLLSQSKDYINDDQGLQNLLSTITKDVFSLDPEDITFTNV